MQKFLDGLKDFIYDSIDYIIMIGIIGLVVFIIGWRLDLLFADSGEDLNPPDNIIAEKEDDTITKSPDPVVENNDVEESDGEEAVDPAKDGQSEDTKEPEKEEAKKPVENTGNKDILTINIPPGSSSSNIGSILESSGLVASKSDFINKSEEMQLASKLKAGSYEIESGSSIESIINILTK